MAPSASNSARIANSNPSLSAAVHGNALRRSLYFVFVAWIPGAFWQGATGSTAMTPLGEYLGANDFIFSIIYTAGPMLAVLMQLPGSLSMEYLGRRKGLFLWSGAPGRAVFALMGLLPWIVPGKRLSSAAMLAFLVFVAMSLQNVCVQAWANWMSDLVPSRLRGKYFAARSRMGVAVIALSTILVAYILDIADVPRISHALSYFHPATMSPLIFLISLVFIVAGIAGMFDPLLFIKVVEPPMARPPREALWARLSRPMRDRQFRRFVTYYSVWQCANNWCSWFWMVYLLDFMQKQRAAAMRGDILMPWWNGYMFLTAAIILPVGYQIGQFLGYPIWGRAVDRFGRKPVFLVSSSLHTLSWLCWIFLSPAILPWLLLTQILGGLFGGGMDIASFNMMLHFNRKGGPGYQSIGSIIFSTAGALAAIVAGALSTALAGWHWTVGSGTPWEHRFNHYAILIVIGAAIKYTADFVFLPRLQDLDAKPAGHALRYMLSNVHNTIDNVVFVPLRSGYQATGTQIRRWWR